MDIITAIQDYMKEIFSAALDFMEHPENLCELEKRILKASQKSNAEVMGEILTDYDRQITLAPKRKCKYTIQRHDQRTLTTVFGDVRFTHTYYRKKKDGSYHYLLDEKIHLSKNERLSDYAEVDLLAEATNHSYQKAADRFGAEGQRVSKTTVMNKVHGTLAELPMEEPEAKKEVPYLYIEADEDHIHRQKTEKDGCIIGKLAYVHEGKQDVCHGKRELINPVYFGGQYAGNEGNAALWRRVEEYIEKNYDTEKIQTVYLSGDGAAWIKGGVEYVDKSIFVADRFHLMKYIHAAAGQMLDDQEEVKHALYQFIRENRKASLKKYILSMKESAANLQPIEACEKYILNNWNAIQKAFHDEHVYGCSAEGHVSSIYSDRMSSRPMGWSEIGADRMCRLRCLSKTYGDEKIIQLVRLRREKECELLGATGTDGIPIEKAQVRRTYTKAQKESAAYAERIHASLAGDQVKKEIGIRYHIGGL